ncbi:hypothetical protein WJX73_005648 [Symbiochloris irregularis]|uniref:Uncharacterized protein n=1 Tax=Symbiochloris irregularis TaxID=706552 RepID=A0AAW1NZ45_9CHLO
MEHRVIWSAPPARALATNAASVAAPTAYATALKKRTSAENAGSAEPIQQLWKGGGQYAWAPAQFVSTTPGMPHAAQSM